MKYKTIDDVMRAMLKLFPDAEIDEDNYGQLIIYTGLMQSEKGGKIVEFEG